MSDQDFFFDEDEKPADKSAPKAAAKQGSKPSASSKTTPAKGGKNASAPAGGVELTWTITALIGVVALLLGVIVGYAIPKSTTTDQGAAPLVPGQVQAPQLSPEELQSGQLPPNHPNISGATGAATGTASGEATQTK